MRLHEGEIVSSGAEHAIVAATSAWRSALAGAVAQGPCQMTTNGGNINPEERVIRWMSAYLGSDG